MTCSIPRIRERRNDLKKTVSLCAHGEIFGARFSFGTNKSEPWATRVCRARRKFRMHRKDIRVARIAALSNAIAKYATRANETLVIIKLPRAGNKKLHRQFRVSLLRRFPNAMRKKDSR